MRITKAILLGVAALLLVAVLIAGGAVFYVTRTAPGQAWLTGFLNRQLAAPDGGVSIGSIGGDLPGRIELRDLALRDARGVWLRIEAATLVWRPLALFSGTFEAELAEAEGVEVARLPEGGPDPEPAPPEEPFRWPTLPVDVTVERLSVRGIRLAEAVLGVPATLRAEGQLAAQESGAARTHLVIERTDGTQGQIALEAAFRPQEEFLRLDLEASEPPGGLIAGALGLPDRPAVSARLTGEGPLSDWNGRLQASAGDAVGLAAAIALTQADGGYVLDLSGDARVAALLEEALRPLVDDGIAFSVAARTAEDVQTIEIGRARIATAAVETVLTGTVALAENRVDARADIAVREPTALAPFLGPAQVTGVEATATAEGPLTLPRLRLELRAERVAAPSLGLRGVTAQIAVDPASPPPGAAPGLRADLSATVEATGLEAAAAPELAPLLDGPVTARLTGAVDLPAQRVRLTELDVTGPGLRASGSGTADLATLAIDADARLAVPALAPLSPLLGMPVSGAADLTATVEAGDGLREVRAEVSGVLTDIKSPQIPLEALFGNRSTVTAALATSAQTGRHAFEAKLDAAAADLAAEGSLSPGFETVDAKYRVSVADLKALAGLTGTELAGRAEVTGTVEGPTADPTVTAALEAKDAAVAQQPLGTVRGRLQMRSAASAPTGRVEVSATPPGGPAAVSTDFAVTEEQLRLTDLRVQTRDEALTGEMTVPLTGAPIEGRLSGRIADLGPFLTFAGLEGGGTGTARLRLFGERGQQAAEVALDFRNARVAPGGPESAVTVGRAGVEARITAAEPARGEVRIAVRDLRSGEAEVEELTLTAEGDMQQARFALRSRGAVAGPFTLEAAGSGGLTDGGAQVTLARLQGTVRGQRIALRQPGRIAWQPDRITVADLALDLAGGTVRVEAEMAQSEVSGTVEVAALPLSLVQAFAPGAPVESGVAMGRVRFAGPLPNPTGTAEIRLSDLRFGEAPELQPLDARIDADWRAGQLDIRASVGGFAPDRLEASARVPLRLSDSFAPIVPADAPVAGSLQWRGQVEPLFLLLPVDDQRLSGVAALSLSLDGTVGQPRITGYAELSDGEYENLTTGTLATAIALRAEAAGDRITLTRLSARDGGNGTLQATGYAALTGAPLELALAMDDFTVTRRDDVTAALDAELRFVRRPEDSRLSGTITTRSVEIRLVDRLPPQVVDLEPIETGGATAPAEAKGPTVEVPTAEAPIALEVDVSLPRQVFVRGRGIDSEWAGAFAIRGTAANPEITGELRSVRGQINAINNTFELRPSTIRLRETGGGAFEVVIDITAADEAEDLTALVRVTGTAANPQLEITSEPERPQDEVLARILFGKATGELTPIEAVQLAAAVAELTGATGGGPGILDAARGALGLDVLRLGAGSGESAATVTAGKYLADDVFVGVEQGMQAGTGAATVEIEIFPNVSVQSRITQEGASDIGIKMEWDY